MTDVALGEIEQIRDRVERVRVLAVCATEQTKAARGVELDQLGPQLLRGRYFWRQAFDADVLVEDQVNEQRLIAGACGRRAGLAGDPLRTGVRRQSQTAR